LSLAGFVVLVVLAFALAIDAIDESINPIDERTQFSGGGAKGTVEKKRSFQEQIDSTSILY